MAQSLIILLEWLSSGTIWNWKQIFVKLQVSEESIGWKKKMWYDVCARDKFCLIRQIKIKNGIKLQDLPIEDNSCNHMDDL